MQISTDQILYRNQLYADVTVQPPEPAIITQDFYPFFHGYHRSCVMNSMTSIPSNTSSQLR